MAAFNVCSGACHLPPSGEVRANSTSRPRRQSVGNCAVAVAAAVAAAAAGRRYFPRFAGEGGAAKVCIFSVTWFRLRQLCRVSWSQNSGVFYCARCCYCFFSLPRFRPSLMMHASEELIISVFGTRCDLAVAATSASVPGILKISLELRANPNVVIFHHGRVIERRNLI